ncbi:hypothetical protein B0T24DRAFT_641690 [Lasiosphaeria ovina]|uniref:Secreted protein n=1 Tax=Lasiosphaeria ovina TaxID=92902 RepID=A0AAE0JTE9_9PEZI|nr:hypothetical protein B0T24DRAFT_641690 [Lasiosphaeria ovina]
MPPIAAGAVIVIHAATLATSHALDSTSAALRQTNATTTLPAPHVVRIYHHLLRRQVPTLTQTRFPLPVPTRFLPVPVPVRVPVRVPVPVRARTPTPNP